MSALAGGLDELIAAMRAKHAGVGSDDFPTDEFAPEGSYEAELHRAKRDLDAYRGRGGDGAKRQVEFLSGAHLASTPTKKLAWLIERITAECSVTAAAAEPKAAKTWAVINMGLSIANGVPAFGEFQCRDAGLFVHFAAEDSERSLRSRYVSTARGMGLDPVKALANILYQCRGHIDLKTDADLCALIAAVRHAAKGRRVRALALDPLRDVHSAAEDKSDEMTPVMSNLRALRDILGCTVFFVHHTAKMSADKATRRRGQMMRGSTVIHAGVDAGIYMRLESQTDTCWENSVLVETREGRSAGEIALSLELQDDDNGEAEVATWTYSRDAGGSETSLADDVALVLEKLRATHPAGLTTRQLQPLTKFRGTRLNQALRSATDQGLITKGSRGGFKYVLQPSDAPVKTKKQTPAGTSQRGDVDAEFEVIP